MSALRSMVAVAALAGGFVASAEAQGVVPGGWAAQFGYQPFGNGGFVGGGAFATGVPDFGGGFVGVAPFGGGVPSFGFNQGMAPTGYGFVPSGYPTSPFGASPALRQTTVATDPLINAIRQTTRRSRRR